MFIRQCHREGECAQYDTIWCPGIHLKSRSCMNNGICQWMFSVCSSKWSRYSDFILAQKKRRTNLVLTQNVNQHKSKVNFWKEFYVTEESCCSFYLWLRLVVDLYLQFRLISARFNQDQEKVKKKSLKRGKNKSVKEIFSPPWITSCAIRTMGEKRQLRMTWQM